MVGAKEYFIDLLSYHRFLKCLVAIELKIGGFKHEYVGKMDFYLMRAYLGEYEIAEQRLKAATREHRKGIFRLDRLPKVRPSI